MAADAPGRRGRTTSRGSGFGLPAESARAQMVMRIRTILGDPAVAARIEAALRERIAAARPDMPEALRDFLEDDNGSVRLALSLPLGLFHLHADPPPPGTQAAPPGPGHDGVATARCAVSVDALEDAPAI